MSWRARLAEQRSEHFSESAGAPTDKSDKRAFVGFVSDPAGHSENIAALSAGSPVPCRSPRQNADPWNEVASCAKGDGG